MRTRSAVTNVVFLLPQRLYLLDLAGPAEVYQAAIDQGLPYRLSYVADEPEVVTAEGLPIRVDTAWPELEPTDLVVVPGSQLTGLAKVKVGRNSLDVLRRHHQRGGRVVSVCAGAEILGRAGLLDGRRCTTHHDLRPELARRYPAATVVDDVLFVVDGRIATSAGIASGIDLALHLIAQAHGPGAAARIARTLVIFTRRNGDEKQTSVLLRHRHHVDDLVHRLQDLIEERFTERLRLVGMARELGCSERTVTRHFHRATGMTPLRYQQLLRLERAEHLIGQGSTMEAAARAVGLTDGRALRALRG
ncbi:GlxA family transcriptional regulator [Umezawaea tangerina]|uniref:AraC family transcriptional regulator with amidase-like domain n=1 Tax=Umezawaea tangerina TaxID=84725 RepID=A0A2T0SX46_9PSEU|nr:DJ-1/PfpI family protein [Umezawaea tangerina]PRY37982.1 AraC family transcriptional regulator with amidase-like domain [Umezawaea tangerina]